MGIIFRFLLVFGTLAYIFIVVSSDISCTHESTIETPGTGDIRSGTYASGDFLRIHSEKELPYYRLPLVQTITGDTYCIDDSTRKRVKVPVTYTCYLLSREIYWGDTLYYTIVVDNVNDATLSYYFGNEHSSGLHGKKNIIGDSIDNTTHEIQLVFSSGKSYNVKKERQFPRVFDINGGYIGFPNPLPAQYRRYVVGGAFEFLPLQYLTETWPEWEKEQQVQCKLFVSLSNYTELRHSRPLLTDWQSEYLTGCNPADKPYPFLSFTFNLTVHTRSQDETALLKQWITNTPKELLPQPTAEINLNYICPFFKTSVQAYRAIENRFLISVANKEVPLWCFHPWSNRKPGYPNAPTTIQGWRDLEASLVPSTMRDEIQMTRMLLEYYDATGTAQDKKLTEIKAWLESLPAVQSSIMARYYDAPKESPLYDAGQKIKPVIERFTDASDRPIQEFLQYKPAEKAVPAPDGSPVANPPATPTP